VVDCYRGTVNEPVPFRQFLIFKLFFPQFAAGPIMRAHDFLPQIDHPSASVDKVFNGCLLILMGIVKKVLIADRIGSITKGVWAAPQDYDAVYLILILPAFISQIYCDFSGYTDMVRCPRPSG
jgi:D-alanyl-lipoteichoic acid acyltransferase DltB (MBOAT superfamily)